MRVFVKALQDDKLVVFAGAGVSMGSPSDLPSFEQLAINIAKGTGYDPQPPWDQLLGSLQCKGVSIHERALQYLSIPESSPNNLHRNLLLLFRSLDRIRLITTNFDYHFENAAKELFDGQPDIYQAPALPLGKNFCGIVHVHGSLKCPNSMVLTDADFGRAYLTEGWARRFLVEVFQNNTVLFVGYSYNDIVLRYLARALPTSSKTNHFALTEQLENWSNLGIAPIRFNLIKDDNEFIELYNCIEQFAKRSNRGVFDWQNRINEICKGEPPIDDEIIGEIEQALNEVYTTRFFTKIARNIHWPKWLSDRKYLDVLFNDSKLNERDEILASWLVENYVIQHPVVIFDMFVTKSIHMNPYFWILVVRKLGIDDTKEIEEYALSRWITIIIESAPSRINHHLMVYLAERCCKNNTIYLALKIFLFISGHYLKIKHGFMLNDEGNQDHEQRFDIECELCSDRWSLNKIWIECLKPHIDLIAQSLLSGIVYHFECMFINLLAWGKASRNWDICSLRRSAIEPHSQDNHQESIDVLIDVARDTIEWISINSPILLESWSEMLIVSDVPLLRRIAIHAITLYTKKSSDEKLLWLLNHISLNNIPEHHEIYRVLALYYPQSCPETRKQLVDTILSYRLPATKDWSEERCSTRKHFDLLSWLIKVKPDCQIAKEALAPIALQYPKWRLSEHPDFNIWKEPMRWGSISPWTVEQLLVMKPQEKVEDFLSYEGNFFDGPDRDGLISAMEKACKQDVSWAFELIDILVEKKQWNSDIWSSIIRGLQEAELSEQDYTRTLKVIARPELYLEHSFNIACFVYSLVKDEGKPYALNLFEDANEVALKIWDLIETKDNNENISDWLMRAINDTKGKIVEFWFLSLSLLMQCKAKTERNIPDNYKEWFEQIIKDTTFRGGVGRCLLCSQTTFLYGLDEAWVREKIIPLFDHTNKDIFLQVWQGFLTWGNLSNASLADQMLPASISAVKRLDSFQTEYRNRFIEVYTYLAVFIVDDPIEKYIPELFNNGSLHDIVQFASQLGCIRRTFSSRCGSVSGSMAPMLQG